MRKLAEFICASLRSKLGKQPQVATHTAPTLVTNFLQEHKAELSGKTVIPFCTYASTFRDETLSAIVDSTPTASHKEGFGTTKPEKTEVDAWLEKIGEK